MNEQELDRLLAMVRDPERTAYAEHVPWDKIRLLVAEIRRLREALLAAEWAYTEEEGSFCTVCHYDERDGHDPDCLVGRALAGEDGR